MDTITLQRIALYATLGVVLNLVNIDWTNIGFYCILGLFWAADHLGRTTGYEDGVVMGMQVYRNLSSEQKTDVDTIMDMDNK